MRLKGGDRLVFIGGTNAVAELRAIPGLRPATDQLFKLSGNCERKLVEVVLSSFSPAVGRTLVQCAFRRRYNAAVLAISRRRSEERRVGQGGVRSCQSRWWPYHKKKN